MLSNLRKSSNSGARRVSPVELAKPQLMASPEVPKADNTWPDTVERVAGGMLDAINTRSSGTSHVIKSFAVGGAVVRARTCRSEFYWHCLS
jgi:hypothetical protein